MQIEVLPIRLKVLMCEILLIKARKVLDHLGERAALTFFLTFQKSSGIWEIMPSQSKGYQ